MSETREYMIDIKSKEAIDVSRLSAAITALGNDIELTKFEERKKKEGLSIF